MSPQRSLASQIVRCKYQNVDKSSGVGVIDKSVLVLETLRDRPRSLAELVDATGLPRPTAHRLALALEHHGLVDRDASGRFVIGPTLVRWGNGADPLGQAATDVVQRLRDATGESAQVYRRTGDQRLCIAAAEPQSGLRDTVPVGALLTMQAGSAAQVLAAWLPTSDRRSLLVGAAFGDAELATVRRQGWAHSIGQREPGVASLSMPVFGVDDQVIAAVSISGPIERLAAPTTRQRRALQAAADALRITD